MFVSELTSDADYFLVDDDFASLHYDGSVLTYNFTLYGRLIQALIDGNDELQVSIIRETSPKIKYFQGESMADVEKSVVGFVQSAKQQLKDALDEATIKSENITISSLVEDSVVSDIGSKKITTENYVDFLPEVEQIDVTTVADTAQPLSASDTAGFSQLTQLVFTKSGIYPGQVAELPFPAQEIRKDGDGLKGASTTSKSMLDNHDFRDYYETYYVKSTSNKVTRNFYSGKAEYQRCQISISLDLSEYNIAELLSYSNLSLRVSILDEEIPVNAEIFRFNNRLLFEEATAGANNISVDIFSPPPTYVLPDRITVTNRENYPVEVTAFEFTSDAGKILKKQRLIAVLAENEEIEFEGSEIYFDSSESRSYAITANKAIPGVSGTSNVIKMISPSMTSTPPREIPEFALNVKPIIGQNSAEIIVGGVDFTEQDVALYRKNMTTNNKKMIALLRNKNSFIDDDMQIGDAYLYTAEIQRNGAAGTAFASTGYVSIKAGSQNGVSFSITDRRLTGPRRNVHSFKIVESKSTTAARQLLDAANETGQSQNFSTEIEEEKNQTAVISTYSVFRITKKVATVEYLGEYESAKQLSFTVPPRKYSRDEQYEYMVLPKVSSIASLSYSTVVQETDASSGNAYKFLNKKWRDNNFARAELLPSYGEVIRNNIAQAFYSLPAGSYEIVTFGTSTPFGEVTALDAVSRSNSDCAFISWNWTGSTDDILHFVVMASYNGTKAPIGIAMPDRSSSSLVSYCDAKLGSVLGEVLYSILPITNSGMALPESKQVKASYTTNYPREALRTS